MSTTTLLPSSKKLLQHDKSTGKAPMNVINRTTSETLRLSTADPEPLLGHRASAAAAPSPSSAGPIQTLPLTLVVTTRKKIIQNSSSSFQITGVIPRDFAGGEDSADDLDESHTDDISRVTDNETPSFSEDSRDIDDNPSGGGGATASEPTSFIEIHPQQQQENNFDLPSPVLHNHNNNNAATVKPDEERLIKSFKSVAPYARGRWTCHDLEDVFFGGKDEDDINIDAMTVMESAGKDVAVSEAELSAASAVQQVQSDTQGDVAGNNVIAGPNNDNYLNKAAGVSADISQLTLVKPNPSDTLSDFKVALRTSTCLSSKTGATDHNNIDRKIEEALDAVKTHLMVTVHKEVDFLKTKVSTLEGRVNELEVENSLLRVNYLLFKS